MKKQMVGYKGFNPDMTCRDFKFEVGKTYKEKEASLCHKGFHFCENPLDIFDYYDPTNRFHEIIAEDVDKEVSSDSKRVAKKITIGAELSLHSICDLGMKFILSKVDFKDKEIHNTGYYSAASNTGDYSAASNTGYRSAASNTGDHSAASNTGDHSAASNTGDRSAASNTGDRSAASNTGNHSAASNTGNYSAASNTGDRSAASVSGKESVAMAIGYDSKAKGSKGCWIVLSEWEEKNSGYHIKDVQCVKVDGKIIKADIYYKLENGKFIEA